MAATCARVAPCLSPCQVASKYLKDTTAVHGTVNIYVGIGKGPGNGALRGRAGERASGPRAMCSASPGPPGRFGGSWHPPTPSSHTLLQALRGAVTCPMTM